MIGRVKGTQDFLDLTLFNFVVNRFKKHAMIYHFTEISTPIIEPVELFQRGLGEYTDVVTKEMFVFKTESGESVCLRPEGTASTVRAFVENGIQIAPWKIFSVGPMFRYERPQKGRYRQFHQINLEIIGTTDISQDVQCIKMLDRFFHEILMLNNYALLINFLGCFEDRKKYLKVLGEFLFSEAARDICQTCQVRREKNMMRVFDCKNPICRKIYEQAPAIVDYACDSCAKEWQELQDQLHLLSVNFSYKPALVRGLDYYAKTVFEFVSDNLGAQNAFCGGGRYEQLVTQLGGKDDQPSIGAALGIERLILLLEQQQDKLAIEHLPRLHVILPLSAEQHALALLVADELQAKDLCVDILFEGGSVKSMMRKADKMGAMYALIIGEEEQKQKLVMVKNMVNGTQELINQIDVAAYLGGK